MLFQLKLSRKQYDDMHKHLFVERPVGSVFSLDEWLAFVDYKQEWEYKWDGHDVVSTVTLTFKDEVTMNAFKEAMQNWDFFKALRRIRYNRKWIDRMVNKAARKKQWCLSAREREWAEIIIDAEVIKDNDEMHLLALCTDGQIHEVISWFTDEYSMSEGNARGKSIEQIYREYHDYIACSIRASHW